LHKYLGEISTAISKNVKSQKSELKMHPNFKEKLINIQYTETGGVDRSFVRLI